ncbi:aminopeptidase N [bacterium]|nr:aminopeptidase N [bacterium]
MIQNQPKEIYLKDYHPPVHLVENVDLVFDLFEDHTIVTSTLICNLNPDVKTTRPRFVCFGKDLELVSIKLNDTVLASKNYTIENEQLIIDCGYNNFKIEIITRIYPFKNQSLEGLYKSGKIFCTQCEAEGFRKITYFPDRCDVMARYTTKIIANREKYPVLLSNGNITGKGKLGNDRHWVKWSDPYKKPSYLFALVAGDLVVVEDKFITCSGKPVTLQIYVEKENIDRCDHAMLSLKQAMKWDEEVYGREYDLDIFMIVAVNDFNAGAMENKGLNIFNSSLILASPDTATDLDFERIQGVVAHEYFHNWTGNRITCRDWFQLSLKEGLTIFRDQEFSADMTSRTVKRIFDVNYLRTIQFAEDSGPMAHQVRPESYIEINNFYTVTVYFKGAELVRMMATILGKENFLKGMTLYFDRHDGQAVTIEDFVKAMEDANRVDFTQFRLWYTQAGTPEVKVRSHYAPDKKAFSLILSQTCPPTPGQKVKEPFQIPLKTALFDRNGNPINIELEESGGGQTKSEVILNFCQPEQTFTFYGIQQRPIPSILRGFSAPVKLIHDLSDEDLLFLMSHDTDPFNRWESAQKLLTNTILRIIKAVQIKKFKKDNLEQSIKSDMTRIANAFRDVLSDKKLEKAVIRQTLTLPGESYLSEYLEIIDIDLIHFIRERIKEIIAEKLEIEFYDLYKSLHKTDKIGYDPESAGIRSLKNLALEYLMSTRTEEIRDLCYQQFKTARTMTDEMQSLTYISNEDPTHRSQALDVFYKKWKDDTNVMNIWLTIQASSKLTKLESVENLMKHPVFDYKNPNKLRAVIGSFCNSNLINFHDPTGKGYEFLSGEILKLNQTNPQMAARFLTPLTKWKKYDPNRQNHMKSQLYKILKIPNLSKNVFEIASKSLS